MPIEVTASDSPITVSASGTKIDAAVSGGQGPAGPAATITVGTVTTGAPGSSAAVVNAGTTSAAVLNFTIPAGATGATGPAGPQGPAGAAGASSWDDITGKPSTFAPSAHAASHAAGGADEVFDQDLNTTDSPTFAGASFPNGVNVGSAQIFSNVYGFAVTVGSETVFKAGPAWIAVTRPIFFEGPNAETARSSTRADLGLGTLATKSSVDWGTDITGVPGTFTPSSHTHGSITNAGAIGTTSGLVITTGASGVLGTLAQGTAGQVLKVNSGATGVEWGSAAADVSIDTTAADILSASSGSITADDAGSDKLVFWDDSAGKLTYLSAGTNITITDTTISAAGSTSASDLTSGTLAYARMADPTVTSPSQITANQNDYASFARGINRFTTNAARDITGMVAGSDGEVRVLTNVGTTAANTLTIKDESASSTAANRFSVPWNGDCVIPAEGSVVVFYDGTSQRWRVIA